MSKQTEWRFSDYNLRWRACGDEINIIVDHDEIFISIDDLKDMMQLISFTMGRDAAASQEDLVALKEEVLQQGQLNLEILKRALRAEDWEAWDDDDWDDEDDDADIRNWEIRADNNASSARMDPVVSDFNKSLDEELTQDRLMGVIDYNPDYGEFIWLTSPFHGVWPGDEAGWIDQSGHRRIRINGKVHYANRLAFLFMEGRFPEGKVSHLNNVRDDNSFDNLIDVKGLL